jgi:hypothetical protein
MPLSQSTRANHRQALRSISTLAVCCVLTGCQTSERADGDATAAVAIAPLYLAGAPFAVVFKGWQVLQDGSKKKAYAPAGISGTEFVESVQKVEGKFCYVEIKNQKDGSERWTMKGRDTIYFGHFKNQISIEH